jgi:hypothetical protein
MMRKTSPTFPQVRAVHMRENFIASQKVDGDGYGNADWLVHEAHDFYIGSAMC